MKRVRAIIEGRVQGVWFRGWTVDEASKRGLDGWVRNRRDGSVEAVFAGDDGAVDEMLRACWQGPPAAQVSNVRAESVSEPVSAGFDQAPTA
ncbi:acylphosphatase [Limimonas halophila]|uniref:Acylphosphatase n=1 Tax=Limimonas halophila TaxID=1082479 RepID=A0A1G7UQ31_9PROT|nr:acylphosphatase [Limimonas halophila]SDG48810.1 acylphosphatase [Limimonas halophila]